MPKLGAVILAAGGSSRLGRPKQLLRFAGKTLLARAVAAATGSGCSAIVVVLGAQYDLIAPELAGLPVTPVHNPDWQRGIGTSIRRGVRALLEQAAEIDEVLILLCDQPLIDAQAIVRFIEAYRRSRKQIGVSVAASTPGPPVIISAALFPQLLTLPDDRGAKAIWSDRPDLVCRVGCDEAGFDVDTAADVARLAELSPRE
jgi:molybdenum cofactor cytidylyltransferase